LFSCISLNTAPSKKKCLPKWDSRERNMTLKFCYDCLSKKRNQIFILNNSWKTTLKKKWNEIIIAFKILLIEFKSEFLCNLYTKLRKTSYYATIKNLFKLYILENINLLCKAIGKTLSIWPIVILSAECYCVISYEWTLLLWLFLVEVTINIQSNQTLGIDLTFNEFWIFETKYLVIY
jgi:hypothetical protein